MMTTKVSSTGFNFVYNGHIYLTNKRICIESEFLGLKNKVWLDFDYITAIQSSKILGIFDSGILIEYGQEDLYEIGGMVSRDLVLEKLMAIWTSRAMAD